MRIDRALLILCLPLAFAVGRYTGEAPATTAPPRAQVNTAPAPGLQTSAPLASVAVAMPAGKAAAKSSPSLLASACNPGTAAVVGDIESSPRRLADKFLFALDNHIQSLAAAHPDIAISNALGQYGTGFSAAIAAVGPDAAAPLAAELSERLCGQVSADERAVLLRLMSVTPQLVRESGLACALKVEQEEGPALWDALSAWGNAQLAGNASIEAWTQRGRNPRTLRLAETVMTGRDPVPPIKSDETS